MIIISFVRVAILGAQYNDSNSWVTSQTVFGPPRATSAYIASAKKNVKISLSVSLLTFIIEDMVTHKIYPIKKPSH